MLHRLSQVACLACLLAAASTAQAQELGRVDASLTGISYRLVDLAPDDGIAPSIQFDPAANFSGYVYENGYFDLEGGGPFSPGTQEIVSTDGRSSTSLSGQAIHASGVIDEALLRSLRPGQALYTGAVVNATRGMSNPDWVFTLSPHTAIVMEGHAAVHTALDLSPLAGSDLVSGPARTFDVVEASVSYYLHIRLENRDPSNLQSQYLMMEAGTYGQLTANDWASFSYPDEQRDFSLRLENNSDLAGQRHLALVVQAMTRTYGSPPIPEPGALVLALAGAVVMGGVTHARRKRPPHRS